MMANRGVPLEVEIRRRIEGSGPIAVAPYMELCLTHPERGYYTSGDPFGAQGDFITAPEISQMFGELVGLWAAAVWGAMGSPGSLNLVELGPGRGTMMSDVLRVAKVMPGFRAAIALHMIEISPVLERLQRQALSFADVPMSWHRSIEELPDGPLIVLANEFFDALPIHQAVMCADGWHQRVIKIGEGDAFQFGTARDPIPLFDKMLPRNLSAAQIGDIFEWRADNIALEIGRHVDRADGLAGADRARCRREVAGALDDAQIGRRSHPFHEGPRSLRPVLVNDDHPEPTNHLMTEDRGQNREGEQRHAEDQYQRHAVVQQPSPFAPGDQQEPGLRRASHGRARQSR